VRALEIYYNVVFDLDTMADDLDDGHVCERYYTPVSELMDGLTQPWNCRAAFCNPPFDTQTYLAACHKADYEVRKERRCYFACMIIPVGVLSNKSFDKVMADYTPNTITIWTPRVNYRPHPLSEIAREAKAKGKEPKGQANGGTMTLAWRHDVDPIGSVFTRENWRLCK
jgi:hypothetical protein